MADDGDSEGFKQEHHDNYETKPSPVPAMSNCNSQRPILNRTTPSKDMYWFAQTSDASKEETSQMKNNSFSKKEDSYWFAHGGVVEVSVSVPLDDPDGKETLLQKEREERVKLFKEQQEEERQKRQQELEQSFMVAKKYREQQEAERRRKIEEARVREDERRLQVEERKRQIWEAEQERKEAILRRNLEREARIEARRNAQRNSMSFAFGSSTPRTFDLDLAALGGGRGPAQGSVLMSAVSGRRSEEREFGTKRATSACSLDRKFDEDSLYDDNSDISRDCSRESSLEPSPSKVNLAKQIAIEHMKSDRTKACLTMLDDDDTSQSCGNVYFYSSPIPGWLRGSGALVEGEDLMSRSMVSLSSMSRGRRRTDLTPTVPRDRSTTPILISRAMKDNSQSPSRPQSSMSRTSEMSTTSSQASGVLLRPRPAPRRPRPVSIAGTTVGGSSLAATSPSAGKRPERPTRPTEKSAPKTTRAKSAEPDHRNEESAKPRSAPKKPVPPPKTSEILAKAKNRPVPSKDNLRKRVVSAEPAKKSATSDSQAQNLSPSESEIKVLPSSESEMKNLPSSESEVKKLPSPECEVENSLSSESQKNLPSPEREVGLDSSELEVENSVPAEIEVKNVQPSEPETKSLSPVDPQVVVESVVSVACNEQGATDEPVASNVLNNQSAVVSGDQPVVQERGEKESVEATPSKLRITSEEEARAALAEKRRLAREQAEREAELERQRQEELRRQEEEQRRQEELEQKRLEEEQIRLAELHRKLEEEKLRKAIEEQQQREKEEKERKEEEARLKAEKEEQERKAREEAERQRLELEERLRKEEEERAERKRRVEQIMSRTRARGNQAGAGSQPNNQSASKPTTPVEESKVSPPSDNPPVMNITAAVATTTTTGISAPVQPEFSSMLINHDAMGNKCIDVSIATYENNISNKADGATSVQTEILQPNSGTNTGNHVDQLQNLMQSPVIENGHHHKESVEFPFEKTDVTCGMNHSSNRTSECIDISLVAQTNGYSSHEEMSCTTSPEEKSETSDASGVGLAEVISQPCLAIHSEQSEFDQLIDLGQVEQSSNSHLDNYLINSDDLNSNIISPGKPFIAFEDNISKKQETSVTDLLS